MNNRTLYILLVFLGLVTWACSEFTDQDPIPPLDPHLGKSYFFLEEGKYREYNVFQIRYLAVDLYETLNYPLREVVGEEIDPNNENSGRLLYRYKRANASAAWQLDSVWSAQVESNRAIVNENNVPLVKMMFPADTLNSWDRNLFNNKDQEIIRAKTFNEPFTVGFNTFLNASGIEISNTSIDPVILFGLDERLEVYVDSIGMVFKEFNVYSICASPQETGCVRAGIDVIKSGRYMRMELTGHGNINDAD